MRIIVLLLILIAVAGCQTPKQRQKIVQDQKKHNPLAGGHHGWYILAEPEEVPDE